MYTQYTIGVEPQLQMLDLPNKPFIISEHYLTMISQTSTMEREFQNITALISLFHLSSKKFCRPSRHAYGIHLNCIRNTRAVGFLLSVRTGRAL